LAAAAATAYAQAYIEFQRQQSVADDSSAAASVAAEVGSLQSQLDDVQSQIVKLTSADPRYALLQQLHQNLLQQQSVFQQKLDELNVNVELKKSPAALVAPATEPRLPIAPRPRRNTILFGIAAFLLACGVVFGIDYVDDRIKSREDIEAASAGTPILGLLPRLPAVKGVPTAVSVATMGATSGLAESFRSLRTNVQFLSVEDHVGSILVTSPFASEGKTTVAANLAITLGRAGLRVILVDADLRRPRVHTFFGLSESPGLSSVLSGAAEWRDVVQPLAGEPNLTVLTAGSVPANPSELLGTERTRRVLAEITQEYDQVIVDTPPSLPVTDAVALSQRVDACLLVVMAGKSKKRQLARCTQLLRQVNAPLAGMVVNGLSGGFDDSYGYGFGYGYGYGYGYPADVLSSKRHGGKSKGRAKKGVDEPAGPAPSGLPLADEKPQRGAAELTAPQPVGVASVPVSNTDRAAGGASRVLAGPATDLPARAGRTVGAGPGIRTRWRNRP
jgi:capsular exopolysaccharide synthesis family protein